MRHHRRPAALLAAAVVLAAGGPPGFGAAAGQDRADGAAALRTPWGEPDLRGVWRNETETPLERPAELAGKEFYTAEEATSLVEGRCGASQSRVCRDGRQAAEGPSPLTDTQPTGTYNRFWQDTGEPERVFTRTSLITGPDGRIPFTPVMRRESDRNTASYGKGPFNTWRDVDTGERCHTDGLPGSVWTGTAGGPQKISQSPGWVVLQGEQFRDRRIVPTDGRPHGAVRHWLGEGVGRWEGGTLVVETRNFLDKTGERWLATWRVPTETMRLVERFTRVDAGTIRYELTVEDPARFTRPWTVEVPLSRLDQPFLEYACHEGNYGVIHTLSGARAREREAAGRAAPGAR